MAQLRHLTETTGLAELRTKLIEHPWVVAGLNRRQMEQHMYMRAAQIESEIIKRYTGRNAKLRAEKYREALEHDLGPKVLVWTHISRERRQAQ